MGYVKMNIKVQIIDEKKDVVKASNAMTMFKDVIGKTIKVTGILVYEKDELDEKSGAISTKIVSCVKQKNGEFISSISPTIENSINSIVSIYTEEEVKAGLDVIVKSKKSNGGRDFLYLDLV